MRNWAQNLWDVAGLQKPATPVVRTSPPTQVSRVLERTLELADRAERVRLQMIEIAKREVNTALDIQRRSTIERIVQEAVEGLRDKMSTRFTRSIGRRNSVAEYVNDLSFSLMWDCTLGHYKISFRLVKEISDTTGRYDTLYITDGYSQESIKESLRNKTHSGVYVLTWTIVSLIIFRAIKDSFYR